MSWPNADHLRQVCRHPACSFDGRVLCWHSGPCPHGAPHIPFIEHAPREAVAVVGDPHRIIAPNVIAQVAAYTPDTLTLAEYRAARA